jgi:hypothetical protein
MNTTAILRASGLPIFAWLITAAAHAGDTRITIRAGEHDRDGSIVSFAAPDAWKGRQFAIRELGTALQVDENGRAIFVLKKLARGESLTCTLDPKPASDTAGIVAKKDGTALEMRAAGESGGTIFRYQMEPGPVPEGTPEGFAHGAHLHPVFSPSGRLVTGNHPPDHPHQRGIWFAWTHTEFEGRAPDFWNMGNEKHGGVTGEVRFASLDKMWSGPVQGGFASTHRWIDHTGGDPRDVLSEKWEVAVTRAGGANVIDLTSVQSCAGASPLKLPKYFYGGLGVRGNQLWNPVPAVTMLTSNGDDRAKGDATKGKWVHLGGEVDGAQTGIAVLIHPSNFRFPQPLRLNPKNPQICVAPSQDGDWSIEPGKPYTSRYRIVVMDGKADAAQLERLWQDYAEPVTVGVK